MARLMPGDCTGRVSSDRHSAADRGQMFLVVAVVVAALLVVLTVVLNSAMYAGNLTASDDGVDDASALAYRSGVVEGIAPNVTHANRHHNSSYTTLQEAVEAGVDVWSDLAGQQAAADVSGASVDYVSSSDGTLIDQVNDDFFTNDGGSPDWTLVSSTSNVRGFHLDVVRSQLNDPDPSDESSATALANAGAFAVTLDDGTGLWRVFVYQEATTNEVVVRVEDPSGLRSGNCRASAVDGRVLVDVSNATVGGENCPQLDVLDDPADPFDVRFERGMNAAGTYSLVTDETYNSVIVGGDFSNPDAGPRASYALYSVEVQLTYVTPELRYESTVEVVPGETP